MPNREIPRKDRPADQGSPLESDITWSGNLDRRYTEDGRISTTYPYLNQQGNSSHQDQNLQNQLWAGGSASPKSNDSKVNNLQPNSQQHQQLLVHPSEEKGPIHQHPQGAAHSESEAQQSSGVVPSNANSSEHETQSYHCSNNSEQHEFTLPVSPSASSNNPMPQQPPAIHVSVTVNYTKPPVEATPPLLVQVDSKSPTSTDGGCSCCCL